MKVLITGSEGFIGRHLRAELEAHGHDVRGVDLQPPMDPNVNDMMADLTVRNVARTVIGGIKPDVCVHLAAQVGRLFGEHDVGHTIKSNAEMTAYVAQACGDHGVRLCYASTSEIYGDQREEMCDEYEGPFGLPHNLYGLSKRWGEEVSRLYAPDGLTILRPSMPYGTGVPPGMGRAAINNMLWQAATRQAIPVHIGAERSWCWIGDLVRGIRLILEKGEGTYNVGRDDDPQPMDYIAEMACDLANAPHTLIRMVEAPHNQTVVKRLSTARLRSLGWEPQVPIETGMKEVYDWVRRFNTHGEDMAA